MCEDEYSLTSFRDDINSLVVLILQIGFVRSSYSLNLNYNIYFSLYVIWCFIYMCVIAGSGMPVLAWDKRLKIAIGAAKGLAYLHEDCKFLLQFYYWITCFYS